MMKWMGSIGVASLLVVTVFFAGIQPVAAHVLESDLGISAELHIPPLEKPVTGEETKLQFIFEDMPDTFNLVECGCKVQAVSPDKIPQNVSAQLDSSHSDHLNSVITFEEAGEYQVTLSGYTTSAHKNQFKLEYHVDVARHKTELSKSAKLFGAVLIGVSALVAIGVFIWYLKPKRHAHHSSEE